MLMLQVFVLKNVSTQLITHRKTQQISKGVNEAVLFYVEQTITVHIVLFYMWAKKFLFSCLFVFQYFFCVLCTVKVHEHKN